ncbi:histidine phosphatase family protein [Shimia sp.]|uniref:histidine phosphatase family protein n=1 Tax=Shimia sp. TaxID=1954381 RepID=UPI003B8DAE0C
MKAFLIRHAQSTGQAADAPLTDRGYQDARALVPTLIEREAGPLFASPMRRAVETLTPYAEHSGQTIRPLDSLRERLLSPTPLTDWETHIQRSFQDPNHAPEGGESHTDLLARWTSAFAEITQNGGTPAFVTHGGMTSALFHSLTAEFGFQGWKQLRNPDLFEVTLTRGRLSAFTRIELETYP